MAWVHAHKPFAGLYENGTADDGSRSLSVYEHSLGDETLPDLGLALKATVLDSKLRIGSTASLLSNTNVGGGEDVHRRSATAIATASC